MVFIRCSGHRAVGEDPLRALRVELKCVAAGEDLGRERFDARLAGLRADHVDELVLAREQHARPRARDSARAPESRARPTRAAPCARARPRRHVGRRRTSISPTARASRGSRGRGVAGRLPPSRSARRPPCSPLSAPSLLADSARCYGTPAGKVNLPSRIARLPRRVRRGGVQAARARPLPLRPRAARGVPSPPDRDGPTPVEALPLAGAPGRRAVREARRRSRAALRRQQAAQARVVLLGAALARGSRRLVTIGGIGTHHGLATAILRARRRPRRRCSCWCRSR